MRTTLKRGLGRGTGVNGNGRAVVPPGAFTPVTLYRQPPRRRSGLRLVGRILFWLFAAVVMLALGLVGGAYLFFHQSVAAVGAHSADVRLAEKRLDVALPGHAAIALIVGYDHRAGIESNLPSRSDTLMLLRADPGTKSISMLSLPRDLIVDVRCPGRPTFRGRINSAYAFCGSPGSLETVRALTGLPINYLITVNFHGFKEIVDTLGGVWLDVDRRYFNNNAGVPRGETYATIDLQPGYQKLGGGAALDFVRFRHTDSDVVRVARQQEFVRALKQQIGRAFSVTSLPRIIGAMTRNVEIGQGGGESISGKTILSYALFAYELPGGHFFQAKIQGLSGYSELHTDPTNIQVAVREFVNPDVNAPRAAAAVALGRKPAVAAALPPNKVTLTVLNGNGVTGSASNAGFLLGQRGYRIVVPPSGKPANAPSFNYFRTKVYFDRAKPGSRAAAAKVADLFGDADVAKLPPAIARLANGSTLVVAVGQTFHGTLAPPPVDTTPKRQPPAVKTDRAASVRLLTPLRRRVPFRLEVPDVLESSSVPDRELPVRLYFIQGRHKAVRLTFRNGQGEYWGIEETGWDEAPVLAGPNFKHLIKGRELDLYWAGPHLHMVVLRAGGATYWVVNTLLDSLSNETMLAIAEGLRPLGSQATR